MGVPMNIATVEDLEKLKRDIMVELRAELQRVTITPEPEWLPAKEAAKRLGCTTRTILNRANRGEIQARGAGHMRRFRISPDA